MSFLPDAILYVSSDDADVVAAKITGGANDFNVCEEAAHLNKADDLIWRQGKQIWITEVKKIETWIAVRSLKQDLIQFPMLL